MGGVVDYPELEALKESYENGEVQTDGSLSLRQLDKVAGGMKLKKGTHRNNVRTLSLDQVRKLKKEIDNKKPGEEMAILRITFHEKDGKEIDSEDALAYQNEIDAFLKEMEEAEERNKAVSKHEGTDKVIAVKLDDEVMLESGVVKKKSEEMLDKDMEEESWELPSAEKRICKVQPTCKTLEPVEEDMEEESWELPSAKKRVCKVQPTCKTLEPVEEKPKEISDENMEETPGLPVGKATYEDKQVCSVTVDEIIDTIDTIRSCNGAHISQSVFKNLEKVYEEINESSPEESDIERLTNTVIESLVNFAKTNRHNALESEYEEETNEGLGISLKALGAAEKLVERSVNINSKLNVLLLRGKIERDLGNVEYAIQTLENAFMLSEQSKDDELIAKILVNMGEVYLSQGERGKAKEVLEKLKNFSGKAIINVHKRIGFIFDELKEKIDSDFERLYLARLSANFALIHKKNGKNWHYVARERLRYSLGLYREGGHIDETALMYKMMVNSIPVRYACEQNSDVEETISKVTEELVSACDSCDNMLWFYVRGILVIARKGIPDNSDAIYDPETMLLFVAEDYKNKQDFLPASSTVEMGRKYPQYGQVTTRGNHIRQ